MHGDFGKLLKGFVALPDSGSVVLDLYDSQGEKVGSAHVQGNGGRQFICCAFVKGTEPTGFITDDEAAMMSYDRWFATRVDERRHHCLKYTLESLFGGNLRSLAP